MISIIIPVYNVYSYLEECIESICDQTYTDLEIILVDDGSTDNSGDICDKYEKKDSRIKVIHQENQGLSAARNTGIEAADGEFLMFVDSDDRIHPMMIQALYSAISHNKADIAICSHRTIQETKATESGFPKIENYATEILSGRDCIKKIYSSEGSTRQKIDMTVAWNKLYRKQQFFHLRYPFGRLHEDEFLTYKILYPLKKCVYLDAPLYEYRIREGSIMKNKSVDRLQVKMEAFEEKCSYFERVNDQELYLETLRRYETSIAELILFLEKNPVGNDLLHKLNGRFKLVYKEKIAPSGIPSRHKMKYLLFMGNKTVYRILKKIDSKVKRRL